MANRPPPDQRRGTIASMGKGMTIAAWLVALALLTWYFSGMEKRRANPNQILEGTLTDLGTEVTLQRNRWGHYVASGEINGVPVTFMVDTGASMVAIPLALQDKLGLDRGMGLPVTTANGQTTAYHTRIDTLTLGPLSFHDVRAGLTAGMEGDQILLGMSVLSDISFTQQGDQLILRQLH